MRNLGTVNAGVVNCSGRGGLPNAALMNDAAIASGKAALISELEKLRPAVLQPLTSFTYTRDIPIKTGGGWVDRLSAISADYGVSGGSGSNLIAASGANTFPVMQANFDKETWNAYVFAIVMRVKYVDLQRGNITGRSLEKVLSDGIRMAYDKHQEENVYRGLAEYGTYGLVNNPNVTAAAVSTGESGATAFASKTPDEVLADINSLITSTWEQAENDLAALPNHLIMPYQQYNYLATTKVSPLAEKTILTFILENNISQLNGGGLVIGATNFCKGAGSGGTDRMVCYVHKDRFLAVEELVPLTRTMTDQNVDNAAYDSLYMANNSQVEFFYTQTVRYADGI